MSKINLDITVTDPEHFLLAYNENFRRIQEEFQNKVFYRDNPIGEPNSLANIIDMNGNSITNAASISTDTLVVRGTDIGTLVNTAIESTEGVS